MNEWLIETLNDIEKKTKELEASDHVILEELKAVKELLYIVLEKVSEKATENDILRIGKHDLEDSNVFISHPQKNKCLNAVIQLARSNSVQCIIIDEGVTPGAFAAKLNSGRDGDYVFVNFLYLVNSFELQELLLTAVDDQIINVTVGQGDTARKILLDLPRLRYIVYAPNVGILPLDLKKQLREIRV